MPSSGYKVFSARRSPDRENFRASCQKCMEILRCTISFSVTGRPPLGDCFFQHDWFFWPGEPTPLSVSGTDWLFEKLNVFFLEESSRGRCCFFQTHQAGVGVSQASLFSTFPLSSLVLRRFQDVPAVYGEIRKKGRMGSWVLNSNLSLLVVAHKFSCRSDDNTASITLCCALFETKLLFKVGWGAG